MTNDTFADREGYGHQSGFHFDPWLHLAVVWLQKRAFLVSVLTSVQTHCAIYQNIAPVMNILLLISSTLIRAGVAV